MNDLDRFRQQWREELSQRQRAGPAGSGPSTAVTSPTTTVPTSPIASSRAPLHSSRLLQPGEPSSRPVKLQRGKQIADPEFLDSAPVSLSGASLADSSREFSTAETAALELFEKAVDREHVGKMADAVGFYRDAFKIHDKVDKLYREKYFYDAMSTQTSVNNSRSQSTIASTVQSSAPSGAQTPKGPVRIPKSQPSAIRKLVSGSAKAYTPSPVDALADALVSLAITPQVEDEVCVLAQVPLEIIEYILCMVAVDDLSTFARCLRVCKLMNYLGTHTKYIWKTLSLRTFSAQHYSEGAVQSYGTGEQIDNAAVVKQEPWNGDWRKMYLERPQIRFDGLYISTCNYLRPGVGESWYTPILMVTYYRYLRFYRDGSVISLLSTDEPRDVVPVFVRQTMATKEAYTVQRQDGTTVTRPKGIVSGTWAIQSKEGNILIETEGSVDRYMFYLSLSIRSSGVKKQNKLKWEEFWSVNKITSDRAAFSLKNDKAYYFAKYDYGTK